MPIPHLPRTFRFLTDLSTALDSVYERLDESAIDRSAAHGGEDHEHAAGSPVHDLPLQREQAQGAAQTVV